MFNTRTLFILGAGSSAEFGLPLGAKLAGRIAEKMRIPAARVWDDERPADPDLAEKILMRGGMEKEDVYACWLIRDGVQLCNSIDDFLDVHSSNKRAQRAGKMGIVKTVLEAERASTLYFDKSNSYKRMLVNNFENTWIVKFIRLLSRGVATEDRSKLFNNVALISFNYDRSVEHFLLHAVRQLYAIEEGEAVKILQSLKIVHPYGVAAPFRPLERGGIPYGGEPQGLEGDYEGWSTGIKTYTEQITDEGELGRIHEELSAAQRIVFLGFGFHDQNMDLLKPPVGLTRKDIFATASGLSDSDVDVVRSQLRGFFKQDEIALMQTVNGHIVIRSDLKCAEFFDAYSKSLPA